MTDVSLNLVFTAYFLKGMSEAPGERGSQKCHAASENLDRA